MWPIFHSKPNVSWKWGINWRNCNSQNTNHFLWPCSVDKWSISATSDQFLGQRNENTSLNLEVYYEKNDNGWLLFSSTAPLVLEKNMDFLKHYCYKKQHISSNAQVQQKGHLNYLIHVGIMNTVKSLKTHRQWCVLGEAMDALALRALFVSPSKCFARNFSSSLVKNVLSAHIIFFEQRHI